MNGYIDNIIKESVKTSINEFLDDEFGVPLLKATREHMSDYDEPTIVHNRWCVHFPNNVKACMDIVKNGFNTGISKNSFNFTNMTYSSTAEHSEDGYAYAYDVNDLNQADEGVMEVLMEAGCLVLFQTNGVVVYNCADNDYQVMFPCKNTWNRIMIYQCFPLDKNKIKTRDKVYYYGDGMWAVGFKKDGNPLYCSSLENTLKWVITNFTQYKDQLVGVALRPNKYLDYKYSKPTEN